MNAKVVIEKSFDAGKEFRKTWEFGDFEKFLKDEGEYLDRLRNILKDKGEEGDEFTVTYTIILTK